MSSDKIPSVASLDRPAKYQALLKEDRGDDCLSCRVVGESLVLSLSPFCPSPLLLPALPLIFRRRCLPRPGCVQLHLRAGAARAAAPADPQEQLLLRHAQPQARHHGHLAEPGLAGAVAAVYVRVDGGGGGGGGSHCNRVSTSPPSDETISTPSLAPSKGRPPTADATGHRDTLLRGGAVPRPGLSRRMGSLGVRPCAAPSVQLQTRPVKGCPHVGIEGMLAVRVLATAHEGAAPCTQGSTGMTSRSAGGEPCQGADASDTCLAVVASISSRMPARET